MLDTYIDRLRHIFYCNRIMPQAYDDSLSFQELIYHMFKKINECIDTINSFDELANALADYLTKFEETVRDDITAIIREWYEDGTLKDMIEDILREPIDELLNRDIAKIEILDFVQQGRFIHYSGENWVRFPTGGGGIYDGYSNCQGGCAFVHNNIHYFAEVLHNASGQGKLNVYNENSNTPVFDIEIDTNHGQSLTYNESDHCLYFPKYHNGNSLIQDSGIYKVSMDGQHETVLHQVASDSTRVDWWSVKAVKQNDGTSKLYGFKNYGVVDDQNTVDVYEIDFENSTSTKVDTVKLPPIQKKTIGGGYNPFINANCCLNNKYIAVLTWRPSSIMIFDRTAEGETVNVNRKPIWTYEIPSVLQSCYNQGEVEDISLDNEMNLQLVTLNDLHTTNEPQTMVRSETDNTRVSLTTVVRHYVTNISKGNVYSYVNGASVSSPFSILNNITGQNYQFYIDWTTDFTNPLGTSGQPFKTVQEAIEVIRNCPYISSCNIRLKGDDFLPCFITTGKNISISLNNHTLYGVYGGLNTLYIKGGSIAQSCNSWIFGSSNAPLYTWGNGIIQLDNVSIIKAPRQPNEKIVTCTYDAYIGYGLLTYGRVTTTSGSLNIGGYASASIQHNL